MRGRPQGRAARSAADHARRFRCSSPPAFQGRGWRRGGDRDRRSSRVRLGRCHASGPTWWRSGDRDCRARRIKSDMTENLSRATAVGLASMIASRAVSPVEVLDAHLATIARVNPRLNAIVTLVADAARALAEDAEAVRRLKAAGAIVIGKTNTPEFAAGANTFNDVFGVTRNPWNPALSPAGSSGGSAVAVATGMLPLAQGTDFGCSIRMPASFCGIVGIRPTPGLTPNWPMPLAWDPGQVNGPLARTAEDAALMLDAIVGLSSLSPISVAPPWKSALAVVEGASDARELRIAYASDIAGIGV